MPPISYVVTFVLIVVISILPIPFTMGVSIFITYSVFLAVSIVFAVAAFGRFAIYVTGNFVLFFFFAGTPALYGLMTLAPVVPFQLPELTYVLFAIIKACAFLGVVYFIWVSKLGQPIVVIVGILATILEVGSKFFGSTIWDIGSQSVEPLKSVLQSRVLWNAPSFILFAILAFGIIAFRKKITDEVWIDIATVVTALVFCIIKLVPSEMVLQYAVLRYVTLWAFVPIYYIVFIAVIWRLTTLFQKHKRAMRVSE
jgi:hypothetical protein